MIAGIYKITSPTSKVYIGQSYNIKRRFIRYKYPYSIKGQRKLYNSLMKYGCANHRFEIIHELPCDISQEEIDRYEQFYIEVYTDCGFVLMNLKEAGSRGKHSEETKIKIGNSNRGRVVTEETRKRISAATKGEKNPRFKAIVTVETREKMRVKLKGKLPPNTGKPHSAETRAKISAATMGRKGPMLGIRMSEKTKQLLRDFNLGKKHTTAINL